MLCDGIACEITMGASRDRAVAWTKASWVPTRAQARGEAEHGDVGATMLSNSRPVACLERKGNESGRARSVSRRGSALYRQEVHV